jgi:dTDP-glucose 4,6-dehydratase
MQKTVVVIGSNSFSGGDFIDLLLGQTDYRVVGVSRSAEKSDLFLAYQTRADLSRYAFHRLDLNRDMPALLNLLAELRPAYIVNFAAQSEVAPSWAHPEQWFQTNAVAIAALGNFLKDQPWLERYVHISSPEVYGTCEGVVKEDAPLNPSTPYAASKAAGDLMLFTLVKNYNFPLVMVRATNVYGARQQLFKIIPRSVIYLKLGKPIELHGGGQAVKSYIHIRDVSRGELAMMERGQAGQIYHLSPDAGVAVREVVRLICERLGQDFAASTHTVAERLGLDKAYVIDSTKARTELGWQPQVSIQQGLAEVVEWVEAYWAEIAGESLVYVHKI